MHDGAIERDRIAECRVSTIDTVASDHADLDVLAFRKARDEGNQPTVREIGARQRRAGLGESGFLNQIGRSQVWADQFEIVRRQRREKPIG